MANSIELERTFLAKFLPKDLQKHRSLDMLDIYIPSIAAHPKLRIRKRQDVFEITKKVMSKVGDASTMVESTVSLTQDEFNELALVKGKRVHKTRFLYPYQGLTAEVDVFRDNLSGLVMVDFEFASQADKEEFIMPDFCLTEITQEDRLAGGMLCGKQYKEIEPILAEYGYKAL